MSHLSAPDLLLYFVFQIPSNPWLVDLSFSKVVLRKIGVIEQVAIYAVDKSSTL